MADRIEKRHTWAGTGMMNTPEALSELEQRKELHERLIQGKGPRTFDEIFEEKLHGKPEPEQVEEETKGAIEPLLGLAPSQSAALATGKKGRAGRVIIKG
ncbi:MAG: hypothetical protein HYV07_18055 [Deltaproteobacteria bacterium]|nr:hypothetical protein [Deltaproteobacteria bacterium]